jgi:hypothetical protein
MKAFLLARGEGVDRFYWYAWDNLNFGFVEPTSGALKPEVAAWNRAAEAMIGATVLPCQQRAIEWRCSLRYADGTVRQVVWPSPLLALTAREGLGDYPTTSQLRWLP